MKWTVYYTEPGRKTPRAHTVEADRIGIPPSGHLELFNNPETEGTQPQIVKIFAPGTWVSVERVEQ